jgi:hypothetical protein
MTLADRIEAIVFAFDAGDSRRDEVRALAAEVRALPVLRTCGECRWCHPSEVCTHPKAHTEHEIDGCALPPPSWCPLRGGKR